MKVIAQRYILYNGRAYNKGEAIFNPEPEMVKLWLANEAVIVPDGTMPQPAAETTEEPTAEETEDTATEEEPAAEAPAKAAEGATKAAKAKRTTAPGPAGKKAGGTGAEGEMFGRPGKK